MAFYMHGSITHSPTSLEPRHLRGWCFRTVVGWDNPAVAPGGKKNPQAVLKGFEVGPYQLHRTL